MALAGTDLDFEGLSRQNDPHQAYHALREAQPIQWSPQLRGWVLTRYADCVDLLKSPDFSADRVTPFLRDLPEEQRRALQGFARTIKPWVLVLDPPTHTCVRGMMNGAFTPKAAEALRPRIEQVLDDLLRHWKRGMEVDVMATLAYPLPATVIADLIGVPRQDRDRFKVWSDDVAAFVGSFSLEPAIVEKCAASVRELQSYFQALIAQRRAHPQPDLVSAMIQPSATGATLSDDELFANCAFLLFAGHETTTNLIGNGLYWLLRHPDQAARLHRDPKLVSTAIEEFLRYDPSVDRISRIAARPTRIAGHSIEPGQRVIALTAAANRDPRQFQDPDVLDVGRRDNRHLAFGLGAHFCFGAPLARVEAEVVFRRLIDSFPSIELREPRPEWTDTLGFRGLKRLRVRLG